MNKNFLLLMAMLLSMQVAVAETLVFRGVKDKIRYDDGEDMHSEYLGWDAEAGKAIFSTDIGTWELTTGSSKVTSKLDHDDILLYGNSGSICVNGVITTIFSHEDPEATEEGAVEFVVRRWNATTLEQIGEKQTFKRSADLESAGMAQNPVDGRIYGLFYITSIEIPEEELDPEDIQEGLNHDAGYALCTINLNTMEVKVITPGLYYDNFVAFAISPEGRMFAMTAGGTLVEFNGATGLIKSQIKMGDHKSQARRQAACFDIKTGKLYWNAYINDGMEYRNGSYTRMDQREWKTNGMFDTALYEVDINTGELTNLGKIENRITFSSLWIAGQENNGIAIPTEETAVETVYEDQTVGYYNLLGQPVSADTKGLVIVRKGGKGTKTYRF